jgi:hypothetical protein
MALLQVRTKDTASPAGSRASSRPGSAQTSPRNPYGPGFQAAKSTELSALAVAERRETVSVSALANPISLGAMAERRRQTAMVTASPSRAFAHERTLGESVPPSSPALSVESERTPGTPPPLLTLAERRHKTTLARARSLAQLANPECRTTAKHPRPQPNPLQIAPARTTAHSESDGLGKLRVPCSDRD